MNLLRKFSGLSYSEKKSKEDRARPDESALDDSALAVDDQGVTKESEDIPEEQGQSRLNLFKSIQAKIGADISQGISLPVWLCEPTTTLQRLAEMVHFANLLNTAADLEHSVDRIAYVGAFFATGYNGTERFYKPFNPVLGETFEFVDTNNNFRYISEQVSHHPPVAACRSESDKFEMWQDSSPKTVFLGNSVDILTNARTHIRFPRTNDHFVIEQSPNTRVHNLLIGRSWIDHYGECLIVNRTTNDSCTINFQKCGFLNQGRHSLVGQAVDASGKVCIELSGKWSKSIELSWLYEGSQPRGTDKLVWSRPERNAVGKFRVTEYVMQLNECPDKLARILPCTDSRLRPDRKHIERGDVNTAGIWKGRLEERQRTDRKQREKGQLPEWKPSWFKLSPEEAGSDKLMWQYTGGYWEAREEKKALIAQADSSPEARIKERDLLIGPCVLGTVCDFSNAD